MPLEYKNRIFELINNHHWLEDYNNGVKNEMDVVVMFRRKGDLKIARIMAQADLKSVKTDGSYYNNYINALDKSTQKPIDSALESINTHGQLFLTSKITDLSKIPTVDYNGQQYKVLNLKDKNFTDETDLSQFGFEKGTTVDNLRLFVHTVDDDEICSFENVFHLSDPTNEGLICASYISVKNNQTFNDNIFGVSLNSENVNIINAAPFDQYSPMEQRNIKGFSSFVTTSNGKRNTISDRTPIPKIRFFDFDENKDMYRQLIPAVIKEKLQISDGEYSDLYKKIQDYEFSPIFDSEVITVGKKEFTVKEIKQAIKEANEYIFPITDEFSEVNLYTPKVNAVIAKVNSIEDVPQKLLDFAQKHNLPVLLLGS